MSYLTSYSLSLTFKQQWKELGVTRGENPSILGICFRMFWIASCRFHWVSKEITLYSWFAFRQLKLGDMDCMLLILRWLEVRLWARGSKNMTPKTPAGFGIHVFNRLHFSRRKKSMKFTSIVCFWDIWS